MLRPDLLAVVAPAVVRSLPMTTPGDTTARLLRTKQRLYVLCQTVGWGLFLVSQLAFSYVLSEGEERRRLTAFSGISSLSVAVVLGFLLSHYSRSTMAAWGWKNLGWRRLIPRLLFMGGSLSLLWVAGNFSYTYLIVRLPWPEKYSPAVIMFFAWFNGSVMLLGWLCFYFFYHTFDRLNRLQVEQLLLTANVKEAELRALKSQVNPHFLFNSLNSLRALIEEDAPRARESVTRLANMLRYSLQSGQQETVSLADELRIVEDYLALEQIRHEDRLRVRWDIAEEARACHLPPMLLQTLVENAVKYGISPRRGGGELVIAASSGTPAGGTPGTLHLRVTNPGDLSGPATTAAARAGSSTGVGLRNASERLQLLYGKQATLRLLAEPAGFVTAEVSIPLPPHS